MLVMPKAQKGNMYLPHNNQKHATIKNNKSAGETTMFHGCAFLVVTLMSYPWTWMHILTLVTYGQTSLNTFQVFPTLPNHFQALPTLHEPL